MFDDTTMEWAIVSRVTMDKESTKAYCISLLKNVRKSILNLVQQIHFWELLQIGVMQKSQVWERLLVNRPQQNSYEDVRFIGQDHGNVSETVLHAHLMSSNTAK